MEEFPITSIRFNSRQNPDVSSRPRLKITYRCPADFNDSGAIDLTKIQDLEVQARGLIRNYLRFGQISITRRIMDSACEGRWSGFNS